MNSDAILISRRLSGNANNTMNTLFWDLIIGNITNLWVLGLRYGLIEAYVFMSCYISLLKWMGRLLYGFQREAILRGLVADS